MSGKVFLSENTQTKARLTGNFLLLTQTQLANTLAGTTEALPTLGVSYDVRLPQALDWARTKPCNHGNSITLTAPGLSVCL